MIIGCTFFSQRFNISFMSVKRKPLRNALNDIYETYSICINILPLMRFNFKKIIQPPQFSSKSGYNT